MDNPIDWATWFAVALPVSAISIFLIWGMLLVSYRPARAPDGDGEIEIKQIRPTRDRFTHKQWWVTIVCLVTIGLWCVAHQIEPYVGDMGVIAIIPIIAFFTTGVLKKVGSHPVPFHSCTFQLCLRFTLTTGRFRAVHVDHRLLSHGRHSSWKRRDVKWPFRCCR